MEAAGVSLLAVLCKHHLPHGLSHVLCMNSVLVVARPDAQGLGLGFQGLFGGDVIVFFHPLDDVQLP